ncbi:MAG: alpha/beta fold hydrolase [Rhodocyclaceae bacterium]|nr:alpha/beta fold hydrolase [Rhodocyclaceae bacterium]
MIFFSGWGFDQRVFQPIADRIGPRSESIVCGWSLGALRAMQQAARHPASIDRLILIGATPRFVQSQDWPDAQPLSLLEDFAQAIIDDSTAALRRFTTLMNAGDRPTTRQALALLAPEDQATLAVGLTELRECDLRHKVPTIKTPTLLLQGENDPLMPLAAAQWLATHLPHARLHIFPKTAHAPHLSQPDAVAEVISDFLHE